MSERFAGDTVILARRLAQRWRLVLALLVLGCACGAIAASVLGERNSTSALIVTERVKDDTVAASAPERIRPLVENIAAIYLDSAYVHRRFIAALNSAHFLRDFYARHCNRLAGQYVSAAAFHADLSTVPSGTAPNVASHTVALRSAPLARAKEIFPSLMSEAWAYTRSDLLLGLEQRRVKMATEGHPADDVDQAIALVRHEVDGLDFASTNWRYIAEVDSTLQWSLAGAMGGLILAIAVVGVGAGFSAARRDISSGAATRFQKALSSRRLGRNLACAIAFPAAVAVAGALVGYTAQVVLPTFSPSFQMTSGSVSEFSCRYGNGRFVQAPSGDDGDAVEAYLRYRYTNPVLVHRRMVVELGSPRLQREFYEANRAVLAQWYLNAEAFSQGVVLRPVGNEKKYPLQLRLAFRQVNAEDPPWIASYIETAQQHTREWMMKVVNDAELPHGAPSAFSAVEQEVLATAKARVLDSLRNSYEAFPTWSDNEGPPERRCWAAYGALLGLLAGTGFLILRRRVSNNKAAS